MKELKEILIPKKEAVQAVPAQTHHVMVVDVSGSMWDDLPRIQEQLKNKLPTLVNEGDFVSIIWFSGKEQFGALAEKVQINKVTDFDRLNKAIDKWLKPVGMTGFVRPLEEVRRVIEGGKEACSLMFLTDGYDNQWPEEEIIQAVKNLCEKVAAATFVEYGWYCNHKLMERMAETIGGVLVFAKDFDEYDPIFKSVITKSEIGGRKVEIEVGKPLFDLVFTPTPDGAVTYAVEDGKVHVPESAGAVYFFTDKEADENAPVNYRALYQGLAVLVPRRQAPFIRDCLAFTQDKQLFEHSNNRIGKQDMLEYQKELLEAANDETKRFQQGKQAGLKADPNAFTIINLLELMTSFGCKVNLDELKYNRIGRLAERVTEVSDKERAEMEQAIKEAKSAEDLAALQKRALLLTASKQELKFVRSGSEWAIRSVTWNKTRPNVSMMFKIDGELELPATAPAGLPRKFKTFIFRNYTIIRDGLINIEELPLVVNDKKAYDFLKSKGFIDEPFKAGRTYVINLRRTPLINENMIQPQTAKHYCDILYNQMVFEAGKKTATALLNEIVPQDRSKGLRDTYSDDEVAYLQAVGVTDGGYSPQVKSVPGTDEYTAKELLVKFKGMASVPSYNAYLKKLAGTGKFSAGEQLIANFDKEFRSMKNKMKETEYIKWLSDKISEFDKKDKEAGFELATIRFAIIVGGVWFTEFNDTKDCKLTYQPKDAPEMLAEITLKDTPVAI
ncbi:MAG: VWA domain-containing protein [Clostridia bacterium]|nr:VWA domain-containing protein [Clostridia bacterium]